MDMDLSIVKSNSDLTIYDPDINDSSGLKLVILPSLISVQQLKLTQSMILQSRLPILIIV